MKCEKSLPTMCSLINKAFLIKKKTGFKLSCFYLKKVLKAKKAEIYFISIFQLIYTCDKVSIYSQMNPPFP